MSRKRKSKAPRYRPEDDPRFQNRKGPGGYELSPEEALAWFPPLDSSPAPIEPQVGGSVMLACESVRFWLRHVMASVEPGVYFGDVEWPQGVYGGQDRYYNLDSGQNIGFEPVHVFAVQPPASVA